MKLDLDTCDATYVIKGYFDDGVQINNTIYSSSLIISPHKLQTDWEPTSPESINTGDLSRLTENDPEIVVLGVGHRLIFPDMQLIAPIMAQGLGVEIMDTHAACRTYNILIAEKRKVVAGLIIT